MFGRKNETRKKISLYEEDVIYEPVSKEKTKESVLITETIPKPKSLIDEDDFLFEYTRLCFGEIKHKHDDNDRIIEKFKKHEGFHDGEALELLFYRLNETLYDLYETKFLGDGTYQFLNHFNGAKTNEEKIISVIELMDIFLYSMVNFNYEEIGKVDDSFKVVFNEYFNKKTFPPFINMTVTIINNKLIYQFLSELVEDDGEISLLSIINAHVRITQSFYEQFKNGKLEDNLLIQKIAKFFIK